MKLAKWLKQSGLTTVAFGEKVGVTHSTIVRLANGTRQPSMALLGRIMAATADNVTAHDFIVPAEERA